MTVYDGYVTDIEGIEVGHYTDLKSKTGMTVIIARDGAVAGVDVRGGAPGTRETDLLKSGNLVNTVHAIVLSGGSAFGLDSAGGVMKYLEEQSVGFKTQAGYVPIVPAAVIYDLSVGDGKVRPTLENGYTAAKNSSITENSSGLIGAGTGATVGKILGDQYSMPGGLGSATVGSGKLLVSAMAVVNAVGDIYDHSTGEQLCGPRDPATGKMIRTEEVFLELKKNVSPLENTTLAVIVTNAKLDNTQANRVATVSHDAFARSIRPVHTMFDGDTCFVMATGAVEADVDSVSVLGCEALSRAITNAVSTN